MDVVYALQPFPTRVMKTLFLAGPTPRGPGKSWRPEALEKLEAMGFDGHVLVPEPEDQKWAEDYVDQVEWEAEGLQRADVIVFWVPRDVKTLPGLTTNDEWGVWKDSGKVVWGNPEGADHVRYQRYYSERLGVPVKDSLAGTLGAALKKLGEGSLREGEGECQVPLHVWTRDDFQAWYKSQKASGNRLDGLTVEWSFWVGKKRERLFLYSLHANVWISDEERSKSNECLVLRPDVSVVCLYQRGASHLDTKVVLVKEFRTPVRNAASMVYELPGGSSLKQGTDPLQTAADEVSEEVGLTLAPERLRAHGSRQMGATLCAYHAHLYSVELTPEEMTRLELDDSVHGEPGGEERTTIEVLTVGALLREKLVDWPMMGMVFEVLAKS